MQMSTWQLEVLGKAYLHSGSRTLTPERKTAALLVYLALEGSTSRSRLAGLFWPGSPERTARNNLAALVQRLKRLTGEPLLAGTDTLQVTNALAVDAASLEVATLTGEHHTIIDAFAPLLDTYDYDDLSDFGEWLLAERERLSRLYQDALAAQIAKLEGNGAYREAVVYAERLLTSDPMSEETHRHLMRLLYLSGDRLAALGIYARLRELLRREFSVDPLPETAALAREIERDAVVLAAKPQRPTSHVPLRVLRPPLVGREGVWARLEAAWEKGQILFVSGPPGVGKSRLVMDFVQAKGNYLYYEGRPGDAAVPFMSLARACRKFLSTFPEVELASWVRLELTRLLPELTDERPPPMQSHEDELRFHEAMFQLFVAMMSCVATVVTDDLQFYDTSSFGVFAAFTDRLGGEGFSQSRFITCFRQGEVPDAFMTNLELMVASGQAVQVELHPLEPGAVTSLLRGVELSGLEEGALAHLSKDLHRYTGGNPLFLIETLKHLLESGRLGPRLPRPFELGGKVGSLIAQRLNRLSAPAQRLVWTAAVAQTDFSAELASRVLEQGVFDLAAPYRELERTQIFNGHWFGHDLLYETALKSIPAPIKTLLHHRCAAYLETRGESPARVAWHYLEAGDEEKAAPFLLQAAAAAQAAFQLDDAARLYGQVAAILEAQGDTEGAFGALLEQAVLVISHGMKGDKEEAVAKLAKLAETPLQKAKALYAETALLNNRGEGVGGERAAREGYTHALTAGDLVMQAKLQGALGEALYYQDRIEEASDVLGAVCGFWEELGQEAELAAALSDAAITLDLQDRYEEAAHYYRRADELAARSGEKGKRAITLNNFGYSLRNAGYARRSLEPLMEAKELLEGISGSADTRRRNLAQLGESHAQLAEYTLALEYLQIAIALSEEHDLPHGFLHCSTAEVYLSLGQFERAEAYVAAALQQPGLRDRLQGAIWLTKARLFVLKGRDAREAFSQAEALMDLKKDTSGLSQLCMDRAPTLPPARFLEHAQQALEIAKRHELGALLPGAEARCAQALLALGRPGEALQHSASAVNLLDTYDPTDFYRAEVLFTHFRALEATSDPAALEQLQGCLKWVMDVADRNVPPKHRDRFLECNPINHAVLKAARAHCLLNP